MEGAEGEGGGKAEALAGEGVVAEKNESIF